MKEFIEKLIERLEKEHQKYEDLANSSNFDGWTQEEKEHLARAELCETIIEEVKRLAEEYKHKYVSIEVYKQVAGERDIAIEQLHELGYEFGQEIN